MPWEPELRVREHVRGGFAGYVKEISDVLCKDGKTRRVFNVFVLELWPDEK
jgi:hypothetical protein